MTKNEIIDGIKNESLKFMNLDTIYKNNKELVLVAFQQDCNALQFASDEIKNEIGKNNPVEYLEFALLKEKKQLFKEKLNNNSNNKNNNSSTIKKIKFRLININKKI